MMTENHENQRNKLIKALDFCYDKAINGISGLDSASEMADDY
ncbi:hypothetical protein [Paenibacillus radicis (ex Xue et al. 2023)]|uniref:Uncharacterized protein n=1 Tax=Paenibacillus radicis (ex Xue et al. 2023) TaxID=2972489 RepID=A0ABT1YL41_9BACL|nr:hypothetical protein [Paenibacillus radicis (ex Xue et al. 2023)]MCR8633904.1 hypothetical protein [Paenibacillus radicis (ex Xue et al. 2023)]